MSDWLSFVRVQPTKPTTATAPRKTLKDRIIEAFDRELDAFNSGRPYAKPAQARRAWFKDNDGEVTLTIRAGNSPLAIHEGVRALYADRKNFKAVAKGLRAALVSGDYDAEIQDIQAERNRKREARKAS